MKALILQRLRIQFSKTGPARFIGNLDLMRLWERAARRAGVALAYSEGFHPQPRMQLGAPLPLGYVGDAELLDLWLTKATEPAALLQTWNTVLPLGVAVQAVTEIVDREAALSAQVTSARFGVLPNCEAAAPDLARCVAELLEHQQILRINKRGKEYDLRPLVEKLGATPAGWLEMQLAARPAATGRPEEVLTAMGLGTCRPTIHRRKLIIVSRMYTRDSCTDTSSAQLPLSETFF